MINIMTINDIHPLSTLLDNLQQIYQSAFDKLPEVDSDSSEKEKK